MPAARAGGAAARWPAACWPPAAGCPVAIVLTSTARATPTPSTARSARARQLGPKLLRELTADARSRCASSSRPASARTPSRSTRSAREVPLGARVPPAGAAGRAAGRHSTCPASLSTSSTCSRTAAPRRGRAAQGAAGAQRHHRAPGHREPDRHLADRRRARRHPRQPGPLGAQGARPSASRQSRPLAPVEMEAIIAAFTGRDRIIALLLGHCGLRPIEARPGPVGRAARRHADHPGRPDQAHGRLRPDHHRARRDACASCAAGGWSPACPATMSRSSARWPHRRFYDWGRTELKPPSRRRSAARDGVTPYLLRHTHACVAALLRVHAPGAAERMGHAATEHLSTYAHVVKALEGQPHHADLDALIAAARADLAARAEAASARASR